MSIRRARRLVEELPYTLREQIIDYVRSVDVALPEIQREANVVLTEREVEQLLLVATIRKLYSICSSNYWVLDNSAHMLGRDGGGLIRIGATDYSRHGEFHGQLREMLTDLEEILAGNEISDELMKAPYHEVVEWIASGREEN